MNIFKLGKLTAAVALATVIATPSVMAAAAKQPTLSEADFEKAKTMYFQRCACLLYTSPSPRDSL